MIERDFERLAFLARCEGRLKKSFGDALCETAPVGFGGRSPEANLECIRRLRQVLADRPAMGRLFNHFLFAQWVLHRKRLPADWWAAVLADIPCSAYPMDTGMAAGVVWQEVPVLIAESRNGYVRRFMLTVLPDDAGTGSTGHPVAWPGWADALLSEESKAAVNDAATACRRLLKADPGPGFFLFPLTLPNDTVQITGRSLGLPLALGFLSAVKDEPLPSDIVATGVVSTGGELSSVGAMSSKREAAMTGGFSALLCPSENGRFIEDGNPRMLPMPDLHQAWIVARLYQPDQADLLIRFSRLARDPRSLIETVEEVSPEWLNWARLHGHTRPAVEAVLQTPPLLAALTDKLAGLARRSDTGRADAAAALLPADRFDLGLEEASLSAFRWCATNLSIANHRGRIRSAREWAKRADRFLDAAGRADIAAVAEYFNHAFVARHNRYRFTPDPPAAVRRYLDLLERQYAIQCEFGCPTHPVLGRLYGSLSQNYGFCGPEYLENMQRYSRIARRALGEGAVPEYSAEWMRHYNYLTYALLDAGDGKGALSAYSTYMGGAGWNDILSTAGTWSSWQHALTVRLLADLAAPESVRYVEWCEVHLNHPPKTEHPWQLWCVNMGRISESLGAKKKAEKWFLEGVKQCFAPEFGATVRVMALLPLAGLHSLGQLDRTESATGRERIRKAAENLHPGYFDAMLTGPFEEGLEAVWDHPERLFPFNYR